MARLHMHYSRINITRISTPNYRIEGKGWDKSLRFNTAVISFYKN